MRNIAVVPGLLALILTGVLFYMQFHKSPATHEPAAAQVSGAVPPSGNFRVAYFNMDSVETRYQYFKDVVDQLKSRENEMNAELSSMEKGYQKKISEWQKKAPTMTQTEGEQAQQEYAQMQQNFQMRKQSLQEALLKHNEDMKTDIRKKIEDFLKKFNKDKGYNYIISYEANSSVYYKDSTNNITDELIAGLNADYKGKTKK